MVSAFADLADVFGKAEQAEKTVEQAKTELKQIEDRRAALLAEADQLESRVADARAALDVDREALFHAAVSGTALARNTATTANPTNIRFGEQVLRAHGWTLGAIGAWRDPIKGGTRAFREALGVQQKRDDAAIAEAAAKWAQAGSSRTLGIIQPVLELSRDERPAAEAPKPMPPPVVPPPLNPNLNVMKATGSYWTGTGDVQQVAAQEIPPGRRGFIP